MGEIELGGGPISEVTSVTYWRSGLDHWSWQWDGINKITDLCAYETVDVTYSHGAEIGEFDLLDLKGFALTVVRGAFSPVNDSDVTQLTVGDVTEKYQMSLDAAYDDLGQDVLDSYRNDTRSWRA